MPFDICVNEIIYPQNAIIMARFDEEFDFVHDKVNQHDGFPILKRCFKDYYYDAKVEVADLEAFHSEVKMFSEKFLPVDEKFDKQFEQLMNVIHVAIELQRPIEMEAD